MTKVPGYEFIISSGPHPDRYEPGVGIVQGPEGTLVQVVSAHLVEVHIPENCGTEMFSMRGLAPRLWSVTQTGNDFCEASKKALELFNRQGTPQD